MEREIQLLHDWRFALGEDKNCLEAGEQVTVPHTWNVQEGMEDSTATGWYAHAFHAPQSWRNKTVRVLFHAVYHDTVVYLNDICVGTHRQSGYTPFTLELTPFIKYGEENILTIQVSNAYVQEMLPYMRSFDWANDGGIIRDVELLVTGNQYIRHCKVTARPVLNVQNARQEAGTAEFGIRVLLENSGNANSVLTWSLLPVGADIPLYTGQITEVGDIAAVEPFILEDIAYWHFDSPVLYNVKLTLSVDGVATDSICITTGFREFRVEGTRFYLNGEPVRLCGTEWMPGSNPKYGNAETREQLEKMLVCLKESNCVFTRFHWQQADFVYDWCDRHGMLVQEEVPYWGADPKVAGETQKEVFRQQMQEMITAHAHHPSIIAWGVGNELDAQAPQTLTYIQEALAFTKKLDTSRAANYVSNSFYKDVTRDGTVYGDIMMINEYAGTWMPGLDAREEISKMIAANPHKPLVPSEFGLCEPAFPGGDARRTSLFLEKMEVYRMFPEIAGTINFCLNDYRTQMGEEGTGKYRCRVHGSTHLDGTPKPSYFTVQRECAPFVISWQGDLLCITCRNNLPCYGIKGYQAVVLDAAGMETDTFIIPDLLPGQSWERQQKKGAEVAVYRPNGDFAGRFLKD